MSIQDWKTKIDSFFQPKNPADKQRMMKYAIVMPGAILCGIVIIWLLYTSLNKSEEKVGDAFNTEFPEGENGGIKSKAEEYEAAAAAKEHEKKEVTIAALDTIASTVITDSVTQPSAVETSAQVYSEVQQSLDQFYVPDYSQESQQVAELKAKIDELEAQNAANQQAASQPNEMELLERSYQLAAQYMGNGNGGQQAVLVDEPQKERKIMPVSQVNRNVVSTLSASGDSRSFSTAFGSRHQNFKNTISAAITGNQSVTDGQGVKLRTLEPMWTGSSYLPKGTPIVGTARLQGERLSIKIETIEVQGCIMDVDLVVYDADGQEGINIPNSMEADALNEIGANMGSTMGSSINLSTNAGAQLASDVGKGLINGVSQYLNKKLRRVKVHLKSGYKLMLRQNEQ